MSRQSYADFLASKTPKAIASGFAPVLPWPSAMKPFQRDVTEWAVRRGRAAIFAGTGLGKTLDELAWAQQVAAHSGGQALIFTPLSVAEQTVAEARKFGIDGVAYARDRGEIAGPITITNYERRDNFDLSQFAGIALDESGIIKDHDSKTRIELTEACKATPYLLCASATPAPNDWTELGQHAEFLGVMSAKEMLAMFFVHDGSVRAKAEEDWRLKRHAEEEFWRWLASWAAVFRHPRDLGYDEPGYDLPPLHMRQIMVPVDYAPTAGLLFPMEASTLQERIRARKDSVEGRVRAAVEIVASKPNEPWLIWCNLNAESDAIAKAIPGAVNVRGSDSVEHKVANLLGFCRGEPRVLVSKPTIAGRGMNWQHCANMVFVGLNDSFEQLYQAIRRCWRFGQSREVTVYLISSELEGAVLSNLMTKERKYERMAESMQKHMRDLCVAEIKTGRQAVSSYHPNSRMKVPRWLAA